MLTDSEKQWIEQREAMQFLTGTYIADFEEYPLWNPGKDWQDAAEFSERVAAKLAKGYPNRSCRDWEKDYRCPGWEVCKRLDVSEMPCPFAALKGARLQVEEEMDANGK